MLDALSTIDTSIITVTSSKRLVCFAESAGNGKHKPNADGKEGRGKRRRARNIFGRWLKIIKDVKRNHRFEDRSRCEIFRFEKRMEKKMFSWKKYIYLFRNVLFESIHKGLRSCRKKIPNNVFFFPCIRFDFEKKMYFYYFSTESFIYIWLFFPWTNLSSSSSSSFYTLVQVIKGNRMMGRVSHLARKGRKSLYIATVFALKRNLVYAV